jgi:hypothetical protein
MHGMSTVSPIGLDRLVSRIDDAHETFVDTLVDHNASLLSQNNSLRRRLAYYRVRNWSLAACCALSGALVGALVGSGDLAQIADRLLRMVGI